jgi:hypothetical protein
MAVAVLAVERFVNKKDGTISTAQPPPRPRTVDVRDVVAYSEMAATTLRVRSTQDVLPGGYSAAMAPVLVDWDRSDLVAGEMVVRNINDGGNPVSGVTVLRSARIRLDKIKTAEFIMVPLGGPDAISHGQLRFIFEPGGAEFIGRAEDAVGEPDVLGDLVLSWEAWRPPGVDYDAMKGMDHRSYELTARGYSGPQRFLEDELNERGWNVFTLRLPGGREGLIELLKVSLALADGAARHSIGRMLQEAEHDWTSHGPDSHREGGDAAAQWQALAEKASSVGAPDTDPRIDMAESTSYQSLLRSCATMALYSIDVAVVRLIEAGVPHEGMSPTQNPEIRDEPEWMAELAEADIAGIFARAPKAIQFVRANPTSIPGKIPGALDEAGLLVRENGTPVKRHYSLKAETPWGHRDQLLIR